MKGVWHMPGTDAVPYVCARTPGVVDNSPAPAACAKTLLRGTLAARLNCDTVGL